MCGDHIADDSAVRSADRAPDSLNLEPGMEIVTRVRDAASDTSALSTDSMLHTIIRSMQEVVLLLDRDLTLIEASNTAIELMQLPADPRGRRFTPEINKGKITDEDGNPFEFEQTPPVRVLRGERIENEVVVWQFNDGSRGHFMVNATPIRSADGQIELVLIVGRDITQIRELQLRTEKMVAELSWSQRNLRRLVNNMAVGVIFLDSDLRVMDANRAYSREFGASVRLRRGMSIEEALPLARECGMVDLMRTALNTERPVRVKCFRYDGLPCGTTYWNGSAVPVRIHRENGLELSLAVVLVDVTDEIEARDRLSEMAELRAKRAKELEAERARLDTVIQSTPIPLAVVDPNGMVVKSNSAAAALAEKMGLGDWVRGLVQFSGISDVMATDADGVPLTLESSPVRRSLGGEVCVNEKIQIRCAGRLPRCVSLSSAPFRDMQGNVTGIVMAAQDITEELLAQERINEIHRREHLIAEKLQSSLVTASADFPLIEGFEIGADFRNGLDEARVCGDFYDVFRLEDDELGIVIGDVAGKGLKAAVYTAMAKYMLRAYALEDSSPESVLARLNEALTECTPTEVFVTLIYGVLSSERRLFRYGNAGHEPPVLVRSALRTAYSLDVTGRALALAHGSTYAASDVQMYPGDMIVLYTDGITDAGSGADRLGVPRLLETLEAYTSLSADDVAGGVLESALHYAGGGHADDAALLVIKALQSEVVE